MIWLLFTLAITSGTFGRLGGAGKAGNWYDPILDTKWRDIGCSVILIAAAILTFGGHPEAWWAYLLAFGLTWASFTTYWDKLFGKDCFWFSGLIVGVAGLPLMWVSGNLWWIWVIRTGVLAVIWQLLNTFIPQKILIWRRDVVEEFLRYAISI